MLTIEEEYVKKHKVLLIDSTIPAINLIFHKNIEEWGDGCRSISSCEKRYYYFDPDLKKTVNYKQMLDKILTDLSSILDFSGCIVLDKLRLLETNPMLAVASPMYDTELKDDEVDRCPEPTNIMCKGLKGEFKALAALRKNIKEFSGLDSVSIKLYAEWWKRKGAKVSIL